MVNLLVISKNQSRLLIADLDNKNTILKFDKSTKINNFDMSKKMYTGDKIEITNSIATAAYHHNKFKVYGLLNEHKGKVRIIWIKEDDFKNDSKSSLVVNMANMIDISDLGEEIFETNWSGKNFGKPLISRRVAGIQASFTTFYDYIRNNLREYNKEHGIVTDEEIKEEVKHEVKSDTVELDKPALEEVEDNKCNECDNNEQSNGTIDENAKINSKYFDILESKLRNIIEREKALDEREEELIRKSTGINRLLAYTNQLDLDGLANINIDIDNIVSFEDRKIDNVDEKTKTSELAYELMLKALSVNDSVSIPMEYFSKLKCYVKKTLESNLKYTKFKVLSVIKINSTDTANLCALVDSDEQLDKVRITVVKEYNNSNISDEEIVKFEIQYAKLRKQMSYIK